MFYRLFLSLLLFATAATVNGQKHPTNIAQRKPLFGENYTVFDTLYNCVHTYINGCYMTRTPEVNTEKIGVTYMTGNVIRFVLFNNDVYPKVITTIDFSGNLSREGAIKNTDVRVPDAFELKLYRMKKTCLNYMSTCWEIAKYPGSMVVPFPMLSKERTWATVLTLPTVYGRVFFGNDFEIQLADENTVSHLLPIHPLRRLEYIDFADPKTGAQIGGCWPEHVHPSYMDGEPAVTDMVIVTLYFQHTHWKRFTYSTRSKNCIQYFTENGTFVKDTSYLDEPVITAPFLKPLP